MKILFVAATFQEADMLKKIKDIEVVPDGFRFGGNDIKILVTGVGSMSTAWAMKQWLSQNDRPDFAINCGIAGSYNNKLIIGDVVMPVSDCFADAGIEDGDRFLTLSEAGLIGTNEFPFKDGLLYADSRYTAKMGEIIKPVRAITVNTATGSENTRSKLLKKFNPDIETMEGATFFYICSKEKIPFLAMRAISNRIEPRNKSNWNIALAVNNLSAKVEEVLLTLE